MFFDYVHIPEAAVFMAEVFDAEEKGVDARDGSGEGGSRWVVALTLVLQHRVEDEGGVLLKASGHVTKQGSGKFNWGNKDGIRCSQQTPLGKSRRNEI